MVILLYRKLTFGLLRMSNTPEYQREYRKKNKDKINKRRKEWRKRNPEKRKAENLQRWYNITLEQHKQMYINQNGCCAICDKPVEYNKTYTDHSHINGQVRSLLCCRCNLGLHYIEDREYRNRALNYLKEIENGSYYHRKKIN